MSYCKGFERCSFWQPLKQGCRCVPYTFPETKPHLVPMDLNTGFQGLAAWFRAKSTAGYKGFSAGGSWTGQKGSSDSVPWRFGRARSWCQSFSDVPILYAPCMEYSRWWFETFFIFIPIWGKIPILTNIFQMGWNHQPVFIYLYHIF